MKNFEFQRQFLEKTDNPEVLKALISNLLGRVDSLEEKLSSVDKKEGGWSISPIVARKRERLDRIRHGLTELNERMERPYVVSAELQAVKETLEVLSETGECNSVILEGEPGTGKTQWAYSEVGQELQEGKDVSLVHVRVKDTMSAQDLLYSIDDVRRLSDAQAQADVPDAIRSEAGEWKQKIVSGEIDPTRDEEYTSFKEKMRSIVELGETGKDLDYSRYIDLGPLGEAIYQSGMGKKVYLIIDEIEKGREELMTGMLDEIENLTFTITETGTTIKGDKKNLRIVITTNTEDSDKIPPSFRRRSLYHFIEYPDREEMAQIVRLNFPNIQDNLLEYALNIFYQYHKSEDIEKKPSTPELLSWIAVLSKDFDGILPRSVPYKEVLLKYQEDHDIAMGGVSEESDEDEEYYKMLFYLNRLRGDNLDKALNELSPEEISRISQDKETPKKVLKKLSQHKKWEIRQNVAENMNTPSDVIENLKEDDDYDVRKAALERGS